jgi:hypothetical protein
MTENTKEDNIKKILEEVLQKYTVIDVSKQLNIAVGTINRWIELDNIPQLYQFDLMKMVNKNIDYTKYTSKEKDQFFTPVDTVKYCYNVFCNKMKELNISIKDYYYIEPSAGDGSFMKVLPQDKTIGLDIEPRGPNIIQQDYLTWTPLEQQKYIVFGNPPFGLRGSLALRFINHSYKFADFVCFILPQLFESDGKGVPRKRVLGYNLIYSEKIKTVFYEPNKKEMNINVIFQIWSKNIKNEIYDVKEINKEILSVYSLSDGGTTSSTRNKEMLYKCDIYIPSTCFGKENMKWYDNFEKLPNRKGYGVVFHKDKEENINKFKNIKWETISFLSTNSAYNLRTSIIQQQFI